MNRSVILTGYLGKDPETRQTQERTSVAEWYNRVALMMECFEFRTRSRAYLVLSLAAHEKGKTTWYRLVVWNGDSLVHRNIRFSGKGDLVKVKGRPETYRFTDPDGTERQLDQIVVESYRRLRRSPQRLPPEIP